jgi:outer membrane cobalamin receptor
MTILGRPVAPVLMVFALAAPRPAAAQRDGRTAADSSVLPLNEVVVTATRSGRTIRELPANVNVLTREQIRLAPARTLPDLLRTIPGVTMADYQTSIAAHPSRQSPGMRGLGGTSSSRALVLLDGIPLDDPFTGWVSWARVPLDLVERVEVVRGGGAGIWGSRALGGVINIITIRPVADQTRITMRGGNAGTAGASASLTRVAGRLTLTAAGERFGTDGFYVVPESARGAVDIRAGLQHSVAFARIRYDHSPGFTVHAGGDWLDEYRRNATRASRINTTTGKLNAGARLQAGGNRFSLDVYTVRKEGNQLSTSESADRSTETPTLDQFDLPSKATGLNAQWSRALRRAHEITAGTDILAASGAVHERTRWIGNAFTRERDASGNQLDRSLYLQDAFSPAPGWHLLAATRFDRWDNRNGVRTERDIATGNLLVDSAFAARSENRLSYTLAVRHELSDRFSWRASAYSSFRAPTLNELYRPARASGGVIIEPGPGLEAERLTGGEAGFDLAAGARLLARVTGYWTRLHNPIVEITIGTAAGGTRNIPPCGSVSAGGACRQRGNLGTVRSRGLEAELEMSPAPGWSLAVSHVWSATEVTSAPGQEQLVGRSLIGQAPHVLSLRLRNRSIRAGDVSLSGRYVGRRFDDDLNTRELEPFFVLDAQASRPLAGRWEIFGAIENALDREYAINRAPDGSFRVAQPRRVEAGLRGRW